MRKVFRSSPEYVTGLFSETDGKDITDCPVKVGLSPDADHQPAFWREPGDVSRPTPSTVRASLLIGSDTPPGTYVLWVQVVDAPETLARPARNEMIRVV